MWKLLPGEYVNGPGGLIEGPKIVRVWEYPDEQKLLVQSGSLKVEVEGSDFSLAVKSKSKK